MGSTRSMARAGAGAVAAIILAAAATGVSAQDPREGLRTGYMDAGTAAKNLERVGGVPRPEGFSNPDDMGDILFANSDLAFRGDDLFLGSFHGFQIYDISNPAQPRLRTAFPCPGGQGDLSVHGNLLFMSVEMPNGRIDCGTTFPQGPASPDRFLGVRIFDISDLDAPKQVGGVQTCRGSHTHTLVTDPNDDSHVYIYVSGTSVVRPAAELAGCSGLPPEQDPNTSLFRIEVIEVPLDAPQDARIVNAPRIFADASGDISGLWEGGAHGAGTQETAGTDQCHDITAYPEIGLAAGACSGNGILLDIGDPQNPVRVDEVMDPNFAYWHSATFSNAGDKVLFTDEWGGGLGARCRVTDLPEWGANAIFTLDDRDLELAGYFKIPAAQTEAENCVAHNGSLIPVPGRDIMVQAWYQGGISVFDFTDPENIIELAYFDRGPLADSLLLAGHWSAYWYNGRIYGSEIARGLDILELQPSEELTQNEIDAAKLVQVDVLNPQTQRRFTFPAEPVVARAYVDQLTRSGALPQDRAAPIAAALDRAEGQAAAAAQELRTLATQVETAARSASGIDAERMTALAETLRGIAGGD